MNTPQPNIPELELRPPTTEPTGKVTADQPAPHHSRIILIALGLALLAILWGLLVWYKALTTEPTLPPTSPRPTADMNNEPESTTAEAQTESFGVLSTSDEIGAIEADLESTNLDSLESELLQIETELEAAL